MLANEPDAIVGDRLEGNIYPVFHQTWAWHETALLCEPRTNWDSYLNLVLQASKDLEGRPHEAKSSCLYTTTRHEYLAKILRSFSGSVARPIKMSTLQTFVNELCDKRQVSKFKMLTFICQLVHVGEFW